MISNSQIFTDNVFGVSSGKSAVDLSVNDTTTIEQAYQENPLVKMNVTQPTVPSNQGIAKDK